MQRAQTSFSPPPGDPTVTLRHAQCDLGRDGLAVWVSFETSQPRHCERSALPQAERDVQQSLFENGVMASRVKSPWLGRACGAIFVLAMTYLGSPQTLTVFFFPIDSATAFCIAWELSQLRAMYSCRAWSISS